MARYTLHARLEAGELADLFRGEDDGGREVTIKVFSPRTSDPEYGKALAEMSARTAGLGNPGALAYVDVGFYDQRLVAVREHVKGYTLGQAFQRLGSREAVITPELALFLIAEAAQIVGASHVAGFAHGAITPGNLLLGFDGGVRVCDFGALEALAASPALRAFASKGRSGYRAPEVKKAGPAYPTDDIYSLGSILYELLTLTPVGSVRGGKLSTKRDALPAPSRVQRRINQRIDPVVMRALDMAKTRRYEDGLAFEQAIRGLFSVLGGAPSNQALVKFVKELFPTEVKIVGDGGELPFSSAFEIEPIANAPVLNIAPVEPNTLRQSFTHSDIRVLEPDTLPPGGDGAFEQADAAAEAAEGDFSTELNAESAGARPPTKEWYAPPGKMDAGVLRQRASEQEEAALSVSAPTQKASPPRMESKRKEAPREVSMEEPADEEEVAEKPQPDPNATFLDWHAPPPVPNEPKAKPHPRNYKLWGVFLCIAAGAALFSVLAFQRYTRKHGEAIDLKKTLNEALEAPKEAVDLGKFKEDLESKPIKPPETGKPGTLRILSDQPAWVIVDDTNLKRKTPIPAYTVAAGRHIVRFVNVKTGVRIDEEVVVPDAQMRSVTAKFRHEKRR
jgi:eukaryotic-like serine/threonine-protein kinase